MHELIIIFVDFNLLLDFIAAMEDYVRQSTELTFPPGVEYEDKQCLGIPLIDNTRADGKRSFTVTIVCFDPLVRVVPEYSQHLVYIEDNDGKPYTHIV